MELWSHNPQNGVIESLEWLTDVIRCKSAEYRLCLRQYPRQTLSFDHQMSEREYGLAREKARKVGGDPLLVPDWSQMQSMPPMSAGTVSIPVDSSHASAYKSGGSLMLWEAFDYCEVCVIQAVNSGTLTITATTKAYTVAEAVPLRTCTFAQPFECDRPAAHYALPKALFLATATESMVDASAVAYADYRGYPLVTSPREKIGSVSDNTSRDIERFDSRLGGIVNYPLHATARTAMQLSITAQTLQERINLRTFLATTRGRWKAFWLPSWNVDFELTQDIAAGDSHIQIAGIGFVANYGIGTDIAVITNAGVCVPMRITNVVVDGANERLYSTSAFSGSLARSAVDRVCKLTLSRFDVDRLELQYLPGLAMTAVVPTQEVPL
jgi:hypothetical protein